METPTNSSKKIKFHYGYDGVITSTKSDGRLRYSGGTNGILTVDNNITYTELVVKLWDACIPSMRLWFKLPENNVLLLVSSDENLAYVKKLYDQCDEDLKIRVVLDYDLRFYHDKHLYGVRSMDCTKQSQTIGYKVIEGSTRHKAVF